jgi:hypothetical protein
VIHSEDHFGIDLRMHPFAARKSPDTQQSLQQLNARREHTE